MCCSKPSSVVLYGPAVVLITADPFTRRERESGREGEREGGGERERELELENFILQGL